MLLWYLGRTLQFFALVGVGYALIIGLQTQDPRLELKILAAGALQFLCGWALCQWVRGGAS